MSFSAIISPPDLGVDLLPMEKNLRVGILLYDPFFRCGEHTTRSITIVADLSSDAALLEHFLVTG